MKSLEHVAGLLIELQKLMESDEMKQELRDCAESVRWWAKHSTVIAPRDTGLIGAVEPEDEEPIWP